MSINNETVVAACDKIREGEELTGEEMVVVAKATLDLLEKKERKAARNRERRKAANEKKKEKREEAELAAALGGSMLEDRAPGPSKEQRWEHYQQQKALDEAANLSLE